MEMRFKDKSVIVTGAASGIGLLCSQCFSEEGACVTLTDINNKGLKTAVSFIIDSGGKAQGIRADVRNYAEVKRVCDSAVQAYDGIDILVCCAGGASSRVYNCFEEFPNYPVEYLDWGIDVNLKGPMYFAHAAMGPMYLKGSGTIIMLGSITGEEGTENSVDYAAAKSALMNGVLKSLAQCGARYGIRVCTVSPGPVLTRTAMGKMKTLLNRAAEPQEIVDLIMYIASEKASFMTGSNIMIDGGRSSMLPS